MKRDVGATLRVDHRGFPLHSPRTAVWRALSTKFPPRTGPPPERKGFPGTAARDAMPARTAAHARQPAPAPGRAPQGRQRAPRPRDHRHHPRHLQPSHARDAGRGGQEDRRGAVAGVDAAANTLTQILRSPSKTNNWVPNTKRRFGFGATCDRSGRQKSSQANRRKASVPLCRNSALPSISRMRFFGNDRTSSGNGVYRWSNAPSTGRCRKATACASGDASTNSEVATCA